MRLIIGIRTDNPEAEIWLQDEHGCYIHTWHAHRTLSTTLLETVERWLVQHTYAVQDLTGIIVYEGPGSFTGLRIGCTVANTMAYSLDIPIVGTTGNEWFGDGLKKIQTESASAVFPEYGRTPHITAPKK